MKNNAKETTCLFSYRIQKTLIHKIPAIIKIVLLFFVSIRVFSSSWNNTEFTAIQLLPWARCSFYGIITILFLAFAKTPFSSIKKLSYVLFLGFLVTLIKILPTTEEQLLYGELNILGFFEGLLYTARFLISMAFSLVIFETTSRLQILDALEQIENAFAKIIPPIKKLYLAYIISVTICFIPEIFSAWNNITLATKARTPHKASIKNKAINLYSRLMALFYAMFEYAENSRKAISNRINIQS